MYPRIVKTVVSRREKPPANGKTDRNLSGTSVRRIRYCHTTRPTLRTSPPLNGNLPMAHPELVIYHDSEELAAGGRGADFPGRGRKHRGAGPVYALPDRRIDAAKDLHTARPAARPRQPRRTEAVDWSRTFLFFGDERFVPPDDDRSNYKMVRQSLLQNAPIAADHVFAIPTQLASPQQAAEEYARTLKMFFGRRRLAGIRSGVAGPGRRRTHRLALSRCGGPAGDGPLGDLQPARHSPAARRSGHPDFPGVQRGPAGHVPGQRREQGRGLCRRLSGPGLGRSNGLPRGFVRPAGARSGSSIARPPAMDAVRGMR